MDNTISHLTAAAIGGLEQNPIALDVIQDGGVVRLIELKAIGAIAAVLVSLVVIRTRYAIAVHVVAVLQLILLGGLLFADGRPGRDFDMPKQIVDFYAGHSPEEQPALLTSIEWQQRGIRWSADGSRVLRTGEIQ
jgi:hypothetical protein